MRLLKSLATGSLIGLFCTLSAQAAVVTKSIEYKIDGESFTGYLAYDDAIQGKRPGVMIVHEWWGQGDYERGRAEQLAKLGYVAFAADMYGTGKHTADPKQAKAWMTEVTTDKEWWRERAAKAVEVLRSQAQTDPTDIAAIGYCFGGGTMLQMAYGGTDIDGVVSFHGALPAPSEEEQKAIKTKMLVLHGDADPFVADDMEAQFRAAMAKTNADWQMVNYGGVRHSFTNPGADKRGMEALKYDPVADQRSWNAMRAFFEEIFAD